MFKKLSLLLLLSSCSFIASAAMTSHRDLARDCVLISKRIDQLSSAQSDSKCKGALNTASIYLGRSANELYLDEITDAKEDLRNALANIFFADTYECEQLEQIRMAGDEIRQIQAKL